MRRVVSKCIRYLVYIKILSFSWTSVLIIINIISIDAFVDPTILFFGSILNCIITYYSAIMVINRSKYIIYVYIFTTHYTIVLRACTLSRYANIRTSNFGHTLFSTINSIIRASWTCVCVISYFCDYIWIKH